MNASERVRRVGLALVNWFDASAGAGSEDGGRGVDWLRCAPFLFLHGMCLAVFFVGFSWLALAVAVAMYWLRMFAVTGFYHRYFSHRTFRTSRFCQFLFAVAGAAAVQRGPLWWAAHHRVHHRHADQEGDPHSPNQDGFLWSHMLWLTSRANFPTQTSVVPDLARYPELRFLDRFDTLVPCLLAVSLYFLGKWLEMSWPSLSVNGAQLLVWGFFVSTVALFHGTCLINSMAHRIGRRRFNTRDDSRNSFFLALITLGEGWHNNHHYFPTSARQGFYWWEIDVTYYLLRILCWTGLIWDLRPVPERVRLDGRALDGRTA